MSETPRCAEEDRTDRRSELNRKVAASPVTRSTDTPLQHTKHALEALHPNIKVFRYPDHHVSGNAVVSGLQDLHTGLQNFSLKTFDLARASQDALKSLYGTAEDHVLYWAHQ